MHWAMRYMLLLLLLLLLSREKQFCDAMDDVFFQPVKTKDNFFGEDGAGEGDEDDVEVQEADDDDDVDDEAEDDESVGQVDVADGGSKVESESDD